MNKFIRNTILSLALLLSVASPMAILSPTAYANNKTSTTSGSESSITAIDDNITAKFEGGKLVLGGVDANTNKIFTSFLGFIRLLSGGGALVMLMFFVINFVKLGASGTNANARAQAISGLVWSGIATVCLSMSLVIFLFFFNMDSVINAGGGNSENEQSSNKDNNGGN